MRKQSHPTKESHAVPRMLLVALLLALSLGSQTSAQAAPHAQGTNLTVSYALETDPRNKLSLCTGETKVIPVTLFRSMVPAGYVGPAPLEARADAEIQGYANPRDVGHFHDGDTNTTVSYSTGNTYATFIYVADKPGQAKINFLVNSTGDPPAWGVPANNGHQIDVVVADCYEAFASGLVTGNIANNFTKKNICNLKKPFSLKYTGAGGERGAIYNVKDQSINFTPANPPAQNLDGIYISIEKTPVTISGVTFQCELITSGSYKIIWHNDKKTQGDIKLEGVAVLTCGGGRSPGGDTGLLIAIRALNPDTMGGSCEEH